MPTTTLYYFSSTGNSLAIARELAAQRVCPMGNITMADKKPVWGRNCEQCFGCLHWCPQQAVQFGKVSPSRGRYHHPDVKLVDIVKG